jgi:hypothetical protein
MLGPVVLASLLALVPAAPQLFGRASGATDQSAVVSSVISALEPSIAEAVAAALAASRPARPSTSAGSSSGFVPARDSKATPAKYNYVYKVANDGTQTYITQQEEREVGA